MKFLHLIASIVHIPQSWRNWIVATYKQQTHWKPIWYRKAKSWGLSPCERSVKVTVSLTSYPGRIGTVHETINTLLTQTVKPDRIVLWLAEEQFPDHEKDLPRRLLKLKRYGLAIGWCSDLRSYKKLIPALRAYPDDVIITVDDDQFYNPSLLQHLLDSFDKRPDCIHTILAMKMVYLGGGRFAPYNSLKYAEDFGASYDNLLMGGSGTLYPPSSLSREVFNKTVFGSIAPTVDDIWFWTMALIKGTRVCHALGGREALLVQNPRASTKQALWNTNMDTRVGNDAQLASIVERYPCVLERFNGKDR